MREIIFIRKHEERWRRIERHVDSSVLPDPDVLVTEYVAVMDDLSYARSRYPNSHTAIYLNTLASRLHLLLTTNRRSYSRSARRFWTHTVPSSALEIRGEIIVVLISLLFMIAIGYATGVSSDALARTILGDAYVDMTIANIERGEPMGVYSSMDSLSMFVKIFLNNLKVMLFAVALGLIPVFGVMGSLIYHGLMIGCFHALFTRYNMLETSLMTVWIHGAFEISCLVVCAAAGLHAGLSYINPGTYPRTTAFAMAVRRSVNVAIGLIPFILVAAVLEGWVTRTPSMNTALNVAIIVSSFAFIWGYLIILPSFFSASGAHHVRTTN